MLVSAKELPGLAALERDLSFAFALRPIPGAAAALLSGGAPPSDDVYAVRNRTRAAEAFARRLVATPRAAVNALAVQRCGGGE